MQNQNLGRFLCRVSLRICQNVLQEEVPEVYTFFTYALRTVSKYLREKMFASTNDEVAVLFYGTVR